MMNFIEKVMHQAISLIITALMEKMHVMVIYTMALHTKKTKLVFAVIVIKILELLR